MSVRVKMKKHYTNRAMTSYAAGGHYNVTPEDFDEMRGSGVLDESDDEEPTPPKPRRKKKAVVKKKKKKTTRRRS